MHVHAPFMHEDHDQASLHFRAALQLGYALHCY